MLTGLHSARVDVPDLEVAVADFTRMLGVPPARVEAASGGRSRSAFFVLSNTALELRDRSGDVAAGADPDALGQSGLSLVWDGAPPGPRLAEAGVGLSETREAVGVASDAAGDERRWQAHRIDLGASRGIPIELIADEDPAIAGLPEPASDVAPEARVRALDHVVVMSAAPEATRAFYGDALGIRLALDRSFETRGVRLLFFRLGGVTIEIGARLGGEPRPEARDRFGGLAWQVPSIDAIQARLSGDGFDVSEVRDGHKPGTRVCTVRDPVHGVPTLLIEPV